jgi:hypothetical protein
MITKDIDGVPHVSVSFLMSEDCYSTDVDLDETKAEMWDQKLEECNDEFLDSIRKNGILTPIWYLNKELRNGHHRVVCAYLMDIEWLPYVTRLEDSENDDLPESYNSSDYSGDYLWARNAVKGWCEPRDVRKNART